MLGYLVYLVGQCSWDVRFRSIIIVGHDRDDQFNYSSEERVQLQNTVEKRAIAPNSHHLLVQYLV